MAKRTDGKYASAEHRGARAKLKPVIESGQGWCVQGLSELNSSGACLYSTRYIPPGTAWDVAHDDSGTVIIGPAHAKCNRSDGGKRRHAAHRWVL